MTLDNQESEICRQCNFHIRALRRVRPTLSRNTAATLACSIVQSQMDYSNSVFYGMSESNVEKLQTIQAGTCGVRCSRLRSSKEMLMILNWLPVRSRIKYKLAALTYKRSTWNNQCISVMSCQSMNLLEHFVHWAHFSCRCRQHLRTLVGGHSATLPQRFGIPFHMNCGWHHASERFSSFSNSLDSHDTWTRKLAPLKSSCHSYEKWRFINVHIIILIIIIIYGPTEWAWPDIGTYRTVLVYMGLLNGHGLI